MPPKNFIELIGGPGFNEIGETFLGYFKDLCALQPQEKVLEIGCGVGRMAIPLTRYLQQGGEYVGIDIVKDFITWDTNNIMSRMPNFSFVWADIYNSVYNPKGSLQDKDFTFPFSSNSFDMIMLISVFTHMLDEGFVRYVSEISRLLRPGGRCFATFFMLNPNQEQLYKLGRNLLQFTVNYGNCKTIQGAPELAVGYPESYVREVFLENRLQVREPVYYGAWSGRDDFVSYQDMLIAVKDV